MFWGFFLHVFRKIIFSNQSLTLKNSRSSFIFSSEEFYIVKHFWRNWWTKSSPNKMIYLYTYFKIKHLNHHTKWHSKSHFHKDPSVSLYPLVVPPCYAYLWNYMCIQCQGTNNGKLYIFMLSFTYSLEILDLHVCIYRPWSINQHLWNEILLHPFEGYPISFLITLPNY